MWAVLALIPVAVVLAVRNHVQAMPAGKDHGTVGLAVRMWAYYQVVTVIGLGVLVGVLLLAGSFSLRGIVELREQQLTWLADSLRAELLKPKPQRKPKGKRPRKS